MNAPLPLPISTPWTNDYSPGNNGVSNYSPGNNLCRESEAVR
jgi:hypothetical protein